MNGKQRITGAFRKAASQNRAALVMFATSGYPGMDATVPVLKALASAGTDVIELGVPFSDPLAEGPTIQRSSHAALQAGTTVQTCLDAVAGARSEGVETPIVLMGYYNPILAFGIAEFCRASVSAGADGLIVPDLPAAEAGDLAAACDDTGLALVPLVSLTSTQEGIALACRQAAGFVYCVSLLGVTGERENMNERVVDLVKRVRAMTDLPVAVGFGISTKSHVERVSEYADGAVIGSALVNALADGDAETAHRRAEEFVRMVRPGTQRRVVAE